MADLDAVFTALIEGLQAASPRRPFVLTLPSGQQVAVVADHTPPGTEYDAADATVPCVHRNGAKTRCAVCHRRLHSLRFLSGQDGPMVAASATLAATLAATTVPRAECYLAHVAAVEAVCVAGTSHAISQLFVVPGDTIFDWSGPPAHWQGVIPAEARTSPGVCAAAIQVLLDQLVTGQRARQVLAAMHKVPDLARCMKGVRGWVDTTHVSWHRPHGLDEVVAWVQHVAASSAGPDADGRAHPIQLAQAVVTAPVVHDLLLSPGDLLDFANNVVRGLETWILPILTLMYEGKRSIAAACTAVLAPALAKALDMKASCLRAIETFGSFSFAVLPLSDLWHTIHGTVSMDGLDGPKTASGLDALRQHLEITRQTVHRLDPTHEARSLTSSQKEDAAALAAVKTVGDFVAACKAHPHWTVAIHTQRHGNTGAVLLTSTLDTNHRAPCAHRVLLHTVTEDFFETSRVPVRCIVPLPEHGGVLFVAPALKLPQHPMMPGHWNHQLGLVRTDLREGKVRDECGLAYEAIAVHPTLPPDGAPAAAGVWVAPGTALHAVVNGIHAVILDRVWVV